MKLYFLQRLLYLFSTLLLLLQICFIIYYQGMPPHTSLISSYITFYQKLLTALCAPHLGQTEQINLQWTINFTSTLALCFISLILSLVIGIPAGVLSGLSPKSYYRNSMKFFYLIAVSTPTLWLTLFIVALFNQHLDLLPQFSYSIQQHGQKHFPSVSLFNLGEILKNSDTITVLALIKHLLITIGVLILIPTAQIIELSRANTELLTRQNYIQAAIIRGHSTFLLIYRHILINLFPILLPKLYFLFPLILTLCLSIEAIYGWPGMGSWALHAFYQKNYFIIALITLSLGSLNATIYLLCELVQFIMHRRNREISHVI